MSLVLPHILAHKQLEPLGWVLTDWSGGGHSEASAIKKLQLQMGGSCSTADQSAVHWQGLQDCTQGFAAANCRVVRAAGEARAALAYGCSGEQSSLHNEQYMHAAQLQAHGLQACGVSEQRPGQGVFRQARTSGRGEDGDQAGGATGSNGRTWSHSRAGSHGWPWEHGWPGDYGRPGRGGHCRWGPGGSATSAC